MAKEKWTREEAEQNKNKLLNELNELPISENNLEWVTKELNQLIAEEFTTEPNSITLTVGDNPIIVINEEGFRYKGELIEDAGEVYDLFKEFLKKHK